MGHPEALKIVVDANELVEGDYIADEGVVTLLQQLRRRGGVPYICVWIGPDSRLFEPTDKVVIHLEDDGITEEDVYELRA